MKRRFGETLVKLRKAQGFSSAHAFFKQRGGRQGFGLSFANYLKAERGTSLPQGNKLANLASALGFSPESAQTRELILAYFADVLGSDALLASLAAAGPDPVPPSWRLAETATRQAISQRAVQLTAEQYAVIASDERAYACHALLANTKGWVTKQELGAACAVPARDVEAALKALQKAGLCELGKEGARSPYAGRFVVPPVPTPAMASIYAKMLAHRSRWLARAGTAVDYRYLILRAPRAKFMGYLPHLSDVVSMSAIYGDVERADDSEIFLVEGKVSRLFGPSSGR